MGGVTAIEVKFAPETVIKSEPLMEPDVAVTVAVPFAIVLTNPALLTDATLAGATVQATVLVIFCVLPSLKVPVTLSCWVPPFATIGLAGVIARDAKVAGMTVNVADPLIDPEMAVSVAVPVASAVANPPLLIETTLAGATVHATLPVSS